MKFLLFVLELVQAIVNSAFGQKFLMCALFAESTFMENENPISVLDGTQAMRNHQRSPAAKQTIESLAD